MDRQQRYSLLIFSIVYWTLTLNLYVIVRFAGDISELGTPILSGELISQITITGIITGKLLFFLNKINLAGTRTKKSFTKTILLNTLGYLLFFSLIILASVSYGNSLEFVKAQLISTESLTALFFMAINSLVYHFILQMNRMIGPGVLMEFITGKYFNPVEEQRVFMFLDLKSSTQLAEKLGHSLYSKLIQDCFTIVAAPAARHSARIYQYVGDEVVVTWKYTSSFEGQACLDFFFEFLDHLDEKKDYFLAHYGSVPQFKAGVHYGEVMAAEVGKRKSEIAYHGDVLNATSRLQGMCNEFGESLLISEKLLAHVQMPQHYVSDYLGNLSLKGKDEKIKVHSIRRRADHEVV